MANIKSSKKRALQSEARRLRNQGQRTEMRTFVKKTIKALESGDAVLAQAAYREASSKLDRLARKGLIHKNKAARHKSRLTLRLKKLSAAA